MFVAAALVSSPPLLVPELAGAAAGETQDFRLASLRVAAELGRVASRWIAIGAADEPGPMTVIDSSVTGSYRGFGADVSAPLSGGADAESDPNLPLCALTAGWLRTQVAPDATVEVRVIPLDLTADDCRRVGSDLRAELDRVEEPVGILVIGDGATTLTDKAPGAFDDRSADLERLVEDALAAGDVGALARLDTDLCAELGVTGRAPWQVLAAVFADGGSVPRAVERYRGAPYGVGYFVGSWLP